ncbi:DNA-binding MarR family transcriptional regulator [Actinoplanes lutulentus]|uniref:hypothetical protein n=1 Tax=Actinoplanes lutulentus TaxID=1287878 RepID=UPI000DBA9BBF|nr:hypothetical protein [Actinoplanes lutulentus]MBB2948131.1 DNA-binding MarR family transcriptional regulator [Actinoplanes lutulentus]
MRSRYRFTITREAREELEKAGLITVRKGLRNANFHELTDEGWAVAERELTSPPPAGLTAPWLLHYATLRHIARLSARAGYRLADVYAGPDGVEERIREAYSGLAKQGGDLVSLAALRAKLTDVPRAELDRILHEMDRRREIHLDPDPNRKALTDRAKEAAIAIGGEDKHLISIGRP